MFNDVVSLVRGVLTDKRGAALVEYGMLVGLIAVVCIVAVTTLGTDVNAVFGRINTALTPLVTGP